MSDKLDLVIQRLDDLKDSTNRRLDSIDENLSNHMEQTKLVKQLTVDNKEEIQRLKEPRIVIKYIKDTAMFIGAVAGVTLTLLKLTGKM